MHAMYSIMYTSPEMDQCQCFLTLDNEGVFPPQKYEWPNTINILKLFCNTIHEGYAMLVTKQKLNMCFFKIYSMYNSNSMFLDE